MLPVFGAKAAVDDAVTVCIEMTSGEVISLPLLERPRLTFKGTYVILQASENKVLKFKDLARVYFSDEETAVNDATATGEEIDSQFDTVGFKNFAPNTVVRVYNPNGMILKRGYVGADGTLQLTTSDLGRGTYIIKAGKTTFKLMKN